MRCLRLCICAVTKCTKSYQCAGYCKLLRNARCGKRRQRQHLDRISVSWESRRLLRARSETNSSAIAISNVMCPLKYLIYLKSIHGNDGFDLDSVPCVNEHFALYLLKLCDRDSFFFLILFHLLLFIFDLFIYVFFSQAVKM